MDIETAVTMIKLAKPYIPEASFDNIRTVLESGNLVQGKFVSEFEQQIGEYLDIPHVMMVSNGTAALHLALLAIGIKPGDEVIVPAFTYPATANVVEIIGAKPVLVDISLSDFCIDTEQLEKALTDRTRAIIPVHEFGLPADMDPILAVAQRHKLFVIEDAACALGAEYGNRKAGTLGDIGCFSLHPRKAITTGEGGIVVTRNSELAGKIEQLRNHGIQRTNGKTTFRSAGLNYRMTDIQAAMGIPQLKEIDRLIEQRISQASTYNRLFRGSPTVATPATFVARKHIYQTYHVVVRQIDRNRAISSLKQAGIETNLGAQALHCLAYYSQKYGYRPDDFPNAATAYTSGLALPMGWHLSDKEIETVARAIIQLDE